MIHIKGCVLLVSVSRVCFTSVHFVVFNVQEVTVCVLLANDEHRLQASGQIRVGLFF